MLVVDREAHGRRASTTASRWPDAAATQLGRARAPGVVGDVAEAGRDRPALLIWQIVVWSGWRPEYVLPAPATVFDRLGELIADGTVLDARRRSRCAAPPSGSPSRSSSA